MSAKMTLEEIKALAKGCAPGPWTDGKYAGVESADGEDVDLRLFSLASGARDAHQRERIHANTALAMNAPRLLEIAQELDAKVKQLEKQIADDNELSKAFHGF